jgi:hypothetical protein
MSDQRLERDLAKSIERRVGRIDPQTDTDELIRRIDRQNTRVRRRFVIGGVAVVVLAAGLGYLVAESGHDDSAGTVSVADGTPRHARAQDTRAPKDIEVATNAVIQAFHDAYDGGSPPALRRMAVQGGAELEPLRVRARQFALALGYTTEQLDGSTVAVHETQFVDRTHAVVRFTLTIPGHGAVIVDRIGYAVYQDGRWKVALRTSCDLLSLGGHPGECPPPPS